MCLKTQLWKTCWRWSDPSGNPNSCKLHRRDHETSFIREVAVVLVFSWLAEKVMNKRKEKGIRLIVVKVEIVGIW
jgi:hypothetical protein